MRPISDEIAELRGLGLPRLIERYVEVLGRLPRCKQPMWLFRKIAWRLQEDRLGGLSKAAQARLEELIAEIDIPIGGPRKQIKPPGKGTVPGTTVRRVWRGREITATAVEGGWAHEGTTFRSLSAVAKHVTGTHWNGNLFFGLTRRAK